MRTIITETTVFEYNELSGAAKENALNIFWDINVDSQYWFEYWEEDAQRINMEIISHDGLYETKMKFLGTAEETAELILKEHGNCCDSYKAAKRFLNTSEEEYSCDDYLKDIQEYYRLTIESDYEYLTSKEAIEEAIESSDYEFTEKGELI
jgi:hypothetical protein